MASKFPLKIVTPDGKKITEEVEILNVVTSGGALGILAHHLPLVAILEISILNYKKDNKSYDVAISGGIVNVKEDGVIVLAETFETPEEIDLERAKESKKRAEERLSSNNDIDKSRAYNSLKRAENRIKLILNNKISK